MTMNQIKRYAIVLTMFGLAAAIPCTVLAQKTTGLHILRTMNIGSSGGWDYIIAEATQKRKKKHKTTR